MRALCIVIFCILSVSPVSASAADDLDSAAILQASIKRHDPSSKWTTARMKFYAQEPRLGNPARYSEVTLDNNAKTFQLLRGRGKHVSTHIINAAGESKTLFDGAVVSDPELIKKYRLDPARNVGYRKFSHDLYGLPMSLEGDVVAEYGEAKITTFNKEKSYSLPLTLKDGFFSNHWVVYIALADARILGVEMIFPNEPMKGERLYFDKEIEIAGMLLPRMRHWHELSDDSYSGSDIIIKPLD